MATDSDLYGLMAEFETPEELLHAAQQAHDAGFREMDAYSPFEVEGLAEALGARASRIPYIVLAGGILGGVGGYGMQLYDSLVRYPISVGGKPLYHPVFNVPGFRRASLDRFFLAIETKDPKFDLKQTRAFLENLHAVEVSEVEE
jgi:hypothetical protein